MKKAMILAAGLGTRLRPYSRHTPKALFTINERPVVAMVIEKLQKASFDSVIINTHHHHEQIEAFIAASRFAIPVLTRHEPEILGTGGGIRNVADYWENQSLLVINADIVSDIDLAAVYDFHTSHTCPVTMVMQDDVRFNTVRVDADQMITGFRSSEENQDNHRIMAFTGIHVLDRRVLDYLPAEGPAHIIAAYTKMIEADEGIKAYIVKGHRWHDIGTPENYKAAVYDHMAPLAFDHATDGASAGPIEKQALEGDGSDRRWYRLERNGRTIIMVDHGIRPHPGETLEVDAYVAINRHLAENTVAVPRLLGYDRQAGLVFNEDLGDTHLQTAVREGDGQRITHLYKQVIDQWARMAAVAGNGFDTAWTYQTSHYDTTVVLNNECRYFTEAFLQTYLGWETAYAELETEFKQLAQKIEATRIDGFMHRDFQSRNIMVKNGRVFFIDFQGGRIGPIQYDLASLLIDPYVDLTEGFQLELLSYAESRLQSHMDLEAEKFRSGFRFCAVSRNLQILGAFAFLSRNKGKPQFEKYIPTAVKHLERNLACLKSISLPKLTKLIPEIINLTV